MKIIINIKGKEGLTDKEIERVLHFMEGIDYDDIIAVLEGGSVGWCQGNYGKDEFLRMERKSKNETD